MEPKENQGKNPIADSDDISLEELDESLYSRQANFTGREGRAGEFRRHEVEVPRGWGGKEIHSQQNAFQDPIKRMSLLKKFFIASTAFFIISVGVALYMFFGGGNIVSSNNLDISITGPVSIAGGEIMSLEVSVTNGNNADLEMADLIIDYPEGTRDAEDQTEPLKRYRDAFGKISKGAVTSKKVQAVLFGEEGETKELAVSVEYRLNGSNAIFSKKKMYEVAISSAPITLTINAVKEVNVEQETELTVDVVSNSTSVLKNIALSAEYPFGFTFTGADPDPSWSNSFWQLGDISPGGKRTIKLRGKIVGQDTEDRTFRLSVGTESLSNENAIGTNFLTATRKITIRKPFIGTSLALDGNVLDVYIAKPGKIIRADFTISNNAGIKIADIKANAKFTGEIFEPESVSVDKGFYRLSDQTISWDQTLRQTLAVLEQNNSSTMSFSFNVLPESKIRSITNPEMDLVLVVKGKRLNESGISQEVTSTITKKIKVASNLGLSARALYFSGPFTNTGPIPPKVDQDTSYTIVWSLTNTVNDLSNVKVSATLPSYVKWLDVYSPTDEKISYNPIGGQIIWDVGDLKAGTGFSDSPREVYFQVSLSPSLTQVNSVPALMTETTAVGDDSFAGISIQTNSRGSLNTHLSTDTSFVSGQGVVTK